MEELTAEELRKAAAFEHAAVDRASRIKEIAEPADF